MLTDQILSRIKQLICTLARNPLHHLISQRRNEIVASSITVENEMGRLRGRIQPAIEPLQRRMTARGWQYVLAFYESRRPLDGQ